MTEGALLEFDTHKDQHLFPATINFRISIKVLLTVTNLNIFDEQNPLIIRVVFCSKSLVWSEGLLSSSQNVNISMSHPRHLIYLNFHMTSFQILEKFQIKYRRNILCLLSYFNRFSRVWKLYRTGRCKFENIQFTIFLPEHFDKNG